MNNKICILKKTQRSNDKDRLYKLLECANEAFGNENIELTESLLIEASELVQQDCDEKAEILNRLAGMFCSLGLYTTAATYYRNVVELRSFQYEHSHPAMKATLSNYGALLELSDLKTFEPYQDDELLMMPA